MSTNSETALQKLQANWAIPKEKIQELLTIVDTAINRTYLPECINYDAVSQRNIDDEFCSTVRLYKLARFVYAPEDSIMEKLKIVFLSLLQLPMNPSVFLVIKNKTPQYDAFEGETIMTEKGELSLFFGIQTDNAGNSEKIGKMFRESFENTFPGSELNEASQDDVSSKNFENIVCVSAMPSVKKDDDGKAANIGLEQFIDSMRNRDYMAYLIATPVSPEIVQARKRELENAYSQLSIFKKQTLAYGVNESTSFSEGINTTFSTSTTIGSSFTKTTGSSSNSGETTGTSYSYGGSSSFGWSGNGWNSNSGSNSSHSTSSSFSKSETTSLSDSVGKNTSTTKQTGNGTTETESKTTGTSQTLTIENENKNIVCMLEKIDNAIQRITVAEAYGLWECAAYFVSEKQVDAVLAANSYKALVLGDESSDSLSYINTWHIPDKQEQSAGIEFLKAQKRKSQQDAEAAIKMLVDGRKKYLQNIYNHIRFGMHPVLERKDGFPQFQTITPTNAVSGKDLPRFFNIPLKSLPGIVVDSIAAFERSVCIKRLDKKEETGKKEEETGKKEEPATIPLGCVFHMGKADENTRVELDVETLTGHCFISGSTGSGKSNTMSTIIQGLLKLENKKVNFLVIEPAKGEYKKDFRNVEGIQIYTTNPYSERLLHLNPFRFPDGIHVLEHVDRLLNIFGSCWELTAAMPAILKKAVEQAYETAGWDLCGSFYIGEGKVKYPDFALLVQELREIIKNSDYSADAKGDYTGALVTRVESLAGGILGKIFCSPVDISYENLFNSRTIVDLSRLGSPETKSMIMGVLVMLLSEYRMAETQVETNKKLHHVTIIEEAHNLLKNAATIPGGSELVAKSIEMISNAIAEMRTYGEGFIIVDQSPTAVDISAIKNTNTKIVMRLPEQSDCEAMANAMGLNELQQKEIAKLLPGKAIVMQSNWVAAVMVKIDEAEKGYVGTPQVITNEENRKLRHELVLALATYAEQLLAGDNIPWSEAIEPLFKGRKYDAKAEDLRELCEYYHQWLNLDKIINPNIDIVVKRNYGRLFIALLECENCWKEFLRIRVASSESPKDTFTKIFSRYVPDSEIKDEALPLLTDYVLASFINGGVRENGGTEVQAIQFKKLFI